ncbi:DNA polymerase III subunit beta [candidate division KSB3 bacterium]|uniref:Beta sliding clamp n=1 Tax=candidate division KSB3 bacterium TaxID=2044937 RepID=A0A2G6E9U5_9BACT|nr:MAG: DNA polymerase III subunit beta [candidate division KSB3 bacterium]PIE30895.1 MAG: DNA polymerase III subunit beta [candidate division KSB3 bacterium]
MRIAIEKHTLFEGVQRVQNVVDKKNTIPVLSNLLLETDVENIAITLVATNLEVGISTVLPASEVTEGSITIPAQKIFEILRELPDSTLNLTIDENNWVSLDCSNANFKLAGLPRTDFPELPALPSQGTIIFPQAMLKDMIAKTAFAVSNDESRYALTGVLFSIDENEFSMVATDGHRLALIKKPHAVELDEESSREVIIPLKAVNEVKKMCDGDDQISINLGESQIAFRKENTMLVSRLIDAQFPDYRQVIPAESRFTLTADKEELLHAIRRVSLLCSETRLMKFSVSEGRLSLSSNDPNLGEAKESMTVDYDGEELAIGFNAKYVMDFLSVTTGEKIFIKLSDALSPGLFSSDGEEDEGFSCVIMPMRV